MDGLYTINLNEEFIPDNMIMNQESFPYSICDISSPQCNTGYFYMLVSLKYFNYSYIGKTSSIRRRILHHNSGDANLWCKKCEPS